MGGRDRDRSTPEREAWIGQVSDTRLAAYERLASSSGVATRSDGTARITHGEYFKDLVRSEIQRRKSS